MDFVRPAASTCSVNYQLATKGQFMSKPHDLTDRALQGYRQEQVHYAYSSPAWFAYHLGVYLRKREMPAPRLVRMSRGYSLRVDGVVFNHLGASNDAQVFAVADEMVQPKVSDFDMFNQKI